MDVLRPLIPPFLPAHACGWDRNSHSSTKPHHDWAGSLTGGSASDGLPLAFPVQQQCGIPGGSGGVAAGFWRWNHRYCDSAVCTAT